MSVWHDIQGASRPVLQAVAGRAGVVLQVFGHEDMAEDVEVMTLAELFENGMEERAGVVVVEVGTAAVTAEGDEVGVSEVYVPSNLPG